MDPEEFARAMERLSSDLSRLAFEHQQERLEWQRAMEAQSAELHALLARQDAMQIRQDELEALAIEIEDQLQGEVKELKARTQSFGARLDRLEAEDERHETALGDLKSELQGLSRTTDEVFDDLADRVGVFERSLAEFDRTLTQQYAVLTEGLAEAKDQLTEGLIEAQDAASAHADGIVELKDAIATYQERRDALDADSKEQLTAMRARLESDRTAIAARLDALEPTLTSRLASQEAALQELDSRLAARLSGQEEITGRLEAGFTELSGHVRRDFETLGELVKQFAAQGQMLALALESVQEASMTAEAQLGTAMHEQFEALLRQLDQSTSAWHDSLGQTQKHLKEFEAKVAKALGLQRNENLEHERHLTALRDDLAVLGTRVGTIVQLLTKASRPSLSGMDPSAP